MTGLEIIFGIIIVMIFSLLVMSLYFNVKHGILILKITDSIEKSLDILDTQYASISEILEIPIFYDSPQVKQVLTNIEESRNAILTAANYIGKIEQIENKNIAGEQ